MSYVAPASGWPAAHPALGRLRIARPKLRVHLALERLVSC
jgi:hypothetical protein